MNARQRNTALLVLVLSLFISGCGPGQLFGPFIPSVEPDNPRLGDAWKSAVDGMTMVFVPAGDFTMGSNDGDIDEKPVRTVNLEAFWIDKTEVTQSMYAKCTADGCTKPTCTHGGYNYPVVCVDW
ncbi:MAG: SUMF1/EgtB/PvdO family nonheme iron enzyme, partial [Anaerolineaceae bacterium]|nr:SUMF1/EgtB/PvdO family nonheme iron enzyme [Anaerolineaceae bacterium]